MLTRTCRGWTHGTFFVTQGSTSYWTNQSCQVQVKNYHSGSLTYCWNDLRGVTDYIAWNCQAAQGAHGGWCAMNNNYEIGKSHQLAHVDGLITDVTSSISQAPSRSTRAARRRSIGCTCDSCECSLRACFPSQGRSRSHSMYGLQNCVSVELIYLVLITDEAD